MNIKVSVIVPVYNVEEYVSHAINSLLNQTLSDIEIIAVDDGSTDGSGKILDQYAQKYPEQVRVIHIENSGAGNARNEGLKEARGKYIGFLDSDDWAKENMFEVLYNKAEEGYDIVICNSARVRYENDSQEMEVKAYRGATPISTDEFIKRAYYTAAAWNKLFSHEFLKKANVYFPTIPYEDFGFAPTLLTYASKIAYIDYKLYYYRVRENSVTWSRSHDDFVLYQIDAFQYCLDNCNPEKRDLMLYAVIIQLCENIAAFPQYEWYFRQYLTSMQNEVSKNYYLQTTLKKDVLENIFIAPEIPPIIHIFCISRNMPNEELNYIYETFPQFSIKIWNEDNFHIDDYPFLQVALEHGDYDFINDYAKLEVLYREGGIVIDPYIHLKKRFTCCLKHKLVFGSICKDQIHTHIIAAFPKQDFILNLIATHYNPYRDEFLSLASRIRDCLFTLTQWRVSGQSQYIPHLQLAILSPAQLLYPLDIKRNLAVYCGEEDKKAFYQQSACDEYCAKWNGNTISDKTVKELQKRITSYQQSTCWKITRPIRIIGDIIKQFKK